jgi:RNA polymerase sigma factor (sigma-70 family)
MRTGSTRILFPLFLSLLAMGGVARGQEGWSEPEVLAEGAGTFMESSQIRDGLTFPTAMAQDGDRLVFVGPTAEGLWYRPAGDPAEVLPVEVFSPDDLGPWGWEAGEDEEGNLALGYAFLTPTGVSLHARRKLPGGGFSDEEPLHDFPTAGPAIMGSPSMALAPDGTWHVTYRTTEYVNFPDPKATVRLYYFTPGSEPKLVLEQVEEFDISQTALNPRYQGESIAVASTGEVYVAYGNRTDANDRGTGFVRVLRRNAGTGEFEETQAIDADGAPVLRFDDNDGAHLLLNSSLKTAPATPTPGPNETQIESTDHTQVFYVNAAAPDAPVLLAEGEELTLSEPGTFFLGFTGIVGTAERARESVRAAASTCVADGALSPCGRGGGVRGKQEPKADAPGALVEAASASQPSPLAVAEDKELDALLQKCLEELPDHYRMTFVLRTFEDLSYEEIAEAMGCPAGTVKSRLNAARRMLRERLKELAVL